MTIFKWRLEFIKYMEVTTNEFAWLNAEHTIFGINLQIMDLYILGEYIGKMH